MGLNCQSSSFDSPSLSVRLAQDDAGWAQFLACPNRLQPAAADGPNQAASLAIKFYDQLLINRQLDFFALG